MKFCVVGSSKQFFSGLTTHTIFLSNALAARGHEVFVVTFRNIVPRFLYPGRDRVGKGEYIAEFLPHISKYEEMDWNSPRSWLKGVSLLNECQPNVTIMLWWSSTVAHMEFLLALGGRLKTRSLLILEMHEIIDPLEEKIVPIRLYSRLAGRLTMQQFDAYTVPSPSVKEAVQQTYGIQQEKVHVVPIGLYEQYASNVGTEKARQEVGVEGFVILYFGTIRHYKGVSVLVKAFESLPDDIAENSSLVIVGENWGDDLELESLIENATYRSKILFLPQFVSDDKVSIYFEAADVVVQPYLRTCGSGVGQIAVAHGKQVIIADLPVMRESFGDYNGSRFFPPGDTLALRNLLIEEYSSWRGDGTKSYPTSGFTWDEVAEKYEQIATMYSR